MHCVGIFHNVSLGKCSVDILKIQYWIECVGFVL